MIKIKTHTLVGVLFIAGVILLNIPYALLMMNFEYTNILRQPAGYILTQFAAGGNTMIWTWLAFAWTGLPILFGMILLPDVLDEEQASLAKLATTLGIIAAIVQMVGLLRWSFVVPVLANAYVDAAS